MRKYENNRKIALGIIADAKEEFYQMFCELKNRDRTKLAVIINRGIESERKYPLWDRYIILRN